MASAGPCPGELRLQAPLPPEGRPAPLALVVLRQSADVSALVPAPPLRRRRPLTIARHAGVGDRDAPEARRHRAVEAEALELHAHTLGEQLLDRGEAQLLLLERHHLDADLLVARGREQRLAGHEHDDDVGGGLEVGPVGLVAETVDVVLHLPRVVAQG